MIGEQTYVEYSDTDQVAWLNQNEYKRTEQISMFPRHMYSGKITLPQANFICSRPRDVGYKYIYGVERYEHPDQNQSRFDYGRCPNGYCAGHFPGKYMSSFPYNGDENCCGSQPLNMAPARFYQKHELSPYNVSSYSTN